MYWTLYQPIYYLKNLLEITVKTVDRRSEEHTSELQSRGHLVCRLLLEKKKKSIQKSDQQLLHKHNPNITPLKRQTQTPRPQERHPTLQEMTTLSKQLPNERQQHTPPTT